MQNNGLGGFFHCGLQSVIVGLSDRRVVGDATHVHFSRRARERWHGMQAGTESPVALPRHPIARRSDVAGIDGVEPVAVQPSPSSTAFSRKASMAPSG